MAKVKAVTSKGRVLRGDAMIVSIADGKKGSIVSGVDNASPVMMILLAIDLFSNIAKKVDHLMESDEVEFGEKMAIMSVIAKEMRQIDELQKTIKKKADKAQNPKGDNVHEFKKEK